MNLRENLGERRTDFKILQDAVLGSSVLARNTGALPVKSLLRA
jgi:hypothetical protein